MELRTCCFTGHRPKYLPWGEDEKGELFDSFKEKLKYQIELAVLCGYTHFICGMAEGIDLLCGELVVELRKSYPYITLEAAIPWPNQASNFSNRNKSRYLGLRCCAKKVTVLCNHYRKEVFQIRNQYMIDNSSLLIAVCQDMKSGAGQTIRMAQKKGVEIIRVELANNVCAVGN